MIDYLGYILVKLLSSVFCLLPVRAGLFIGRQFGLLVFILSRKRAAIAYANLKAAFSQEKSPSEIKRISRGVYKNLGQVMVEVLRFPAIDRKYIDKYMSIEGVERVYEARSRNKGAIMLTAHFGNWELLSHVGGFLGFPLSVLAREQKHTRLNELLNSYREVGGSRVIKKGLATRELIKALRANEMIGILGDQDAGKLGTFVNFFGRPTSTHSGTFVFAQKTGATVLPAFIIRQGGPYHRLKVLEPVASIQEFNSTLEAYVRQFPSQWLWVHKRWKSTPARSIIILNDGKQGHLNQSIAVAEIIQKLRQDKGYCLENTVCKIIDVKYKNRALRALLNFCSSLSGPRCQGCMRCVRFCLEEESYKALISAWGDIIISCGSLAAPVSIFLARELKARNIVIMKPSLASIKRFNLAIVPRHDRPKPRKNVLVTTGSPNRITGALIQKEAARFSSFLNLEKEKRLGLVLGGDNADYKMTPVLIKKVISQIKFISGKLDLEVMVTTSRRTPGAVERLLKDELGDFANCKFLVIANEKNVEGTIPAILGLCNAVIVSGESMSMISEAASSGKEVLVFALEKRKHRKQTRHEALVRELNRAGFIKLTDTEKLIQEIVHSVNVKSPTKYLNDYDKIYNAVGGLI